MTADNPDDMSDEDKAIVAKLKAHTAAKIAAGQTRTYSKEFIDKMTSATIDPDTVPPRDRTRGDR